MSDYKAEVKVGISLENRKRGTGEGTYLNENTFSYLWTNETAGISSCTTSQEMDARDSDFKDDFRDE